MTTALGIITSAMRKNGALTKNETPSSDEANDGLEMINDFLSSLSNDTSKVYARAVEGFPLVGGTASYTIGTGATFNTTRPIKIISAYVRNGTTDDPIEIVTDQDYALITVKTTQGTPSYLNYDNNFPTATIKLYPVPDSSDTLYLVSEKELTTITNLNTTISLPPGWKRMLIYNLAVEMAPEYGQPVTAELAEIASQSLSSVKRAILASKTIDVPRYLDANRNIYSGYN